MTAKENGLRLFRFMERYFRTTRREIVFCLRSLAVPSAEQFPATYGRRNDQ